MIVRVSAHAKTSGYFAAIGEHDLWWAFRDIDVEKDRDAPLDTRKMTHSSGVCTVSYAEDIMYGSLPILGFDI